MVPYFRSHRVALQLGRIYPHPVQKNRNLRTSTCCRIVLQRSHVTAGFGGGAQLYAAEPLLVHSAEPGRPRPLPVLPLLRYERGCSSLDAANRFACLNMTSTARVIVCRYHALASRASLCVCVIFSQQQYARRLRRRRRRRLLPRLRLLACSDKHGGLQPR
jgi:hypothetical protein